MNNRIQRYSIAPLNSSRLHEDPPRVSAMAGDDPEDDGLELLLSYLKTIERHENQKCFRR